MSWADLFDRADRYDATVEEVRGALASRREGGGEDGTGSEQTSGNGDGNGNGNGREPRDERAHDARSGEREPTEPSPERVVADADVLAADLLVGGPARDALDHLRRHSWTALVASDPLVDDTGTVVASLADEALAADWREAFERLRDPVVHPAGDHPALASAYHGGAMHVLTFDEGLRSASAGAAIRGRVETSVKHPRAFASLFDAASLCEAVEGGAYPGPDRDPRA